MDGEWDLLPFHDVWKEWDGMALHPPLLRDEGWTMEPATPPYHLERIGGAMIAPSPLLREMKGG